MASRAHVLAAAAIVLATDALARRSPSRLVTGVLDETAHLATGLLVAWAAPRSAGRAVSAGIIAGSVGLDADHVPDALWDARWLRRAEGRPVPHSLSTVLALGGAAAVMRRRRPALSETLAGGSTGVAMHLLRDLSVPPGTGVPLLWPLTGRAYGLPARAWPAVLAVLTGRASAVVGGGEQRRDDVG